MSEGPKTTAERSMAYRRRKGIEARVLEPHGTRAGASRHRRAGEQPCQVCLLAEREYMREAAQRRAAREASKKGSKKPRD